MAERKITKAEVLWTRLCPLSCRYCAMKRPDGKNILPVERWYDIVDNLKQLGAGFMAFYGAEPLVDMDKLPFVIARAEEQGIYTTVITSCVVPELERKLMLLHRYGLRSLTVSYDIVPADRSSELKSAAAWNGLKQFAALGDYRDLAVVVTVTRLNYRHLPELVQRATAEDIWVFWDLVHGDRGQPGSKCVGSNEDLILVGEHWDRFQGEVLPKLLELKQQGYKVHASKVFMNRVQTEPWFREYRWNCAKEDAFPGWVTVEGAGKWGGAIYPCDDFNWNFEGQVMGWELVERWDEWVQYWKQAVESRCPGCCWNTHVDAIEIKRGNVQFEEYVHIDGKE